MNDEKYMQMAMRLALKAKGMTFPNPMVGALVVKEDRIIGRGYHEKAGLPHAEISALNEAGGNAAGATLYVTLEPCAHYGRTPPCVDRIIESGIKEVVAGMQDPNPLNNGKGMEILRAKGIKVRCGVLEDELRKINEVFIKYITTKLPFVAVKVGQSLDGRIATSDGDSHWVTSAEARGYARRLRGDFEAVMVGVNTVLRDDPRLEAEGTQLRPYKVIVDSQLSTPCTAKIFSPGAKVVLATLPELAGQETENRQILAAKARILDIGEKNGQINLRALLKKLAAAGITSVFAEGGGTLIGSLFDERLVDKVFFFISPKIIGGKDALGSVMGRGVKKVDKAVRLKNVELKRIGEDFLVEGYV